MSNLTDYFSEISPHKLIKVKNALFFCFLTIGFGMSTWIVRTPSIRTILDASTAQMGLILFGFSLGSMTGILFAKKLAVRIGADRSIIIGLISILIGLITIAFGSFLRSISLIFTGLALIGYGAAIAEVSVNIIGTFIEKILKYQVLTLIHGFFSLGTVLGALWGMTLLNYNTSVLKHMFYTCFLICPIIIYISFKINNVPGSKLQKSHQNINLVQTFRQDPQLISIGLIVLSVALVEGAANDWLPILLVDIHNVSEQFGSLVFIIFATTMTIGRFLGTGIINRFRASTIIRITSLIAAVGIIFLVFSPNVITACFGVILWGVGTSLGFPLAMSAGAASGENPAERISVLATLGYTAFLVGPPALGFIGEQIGLPITMLFVALLLFIPVILSKSLTPKTCTSNQQNFEK